MNYYWRHCSAGDHVEATMECAIAVFEEAKNSMERPKYRITDVQIATLEAEIEDLLSVARAGNLKPIDEVKPIRGASELPEELRMFEIRWNDIVLYKIDMVTGGFESTSALLRLYYVESDADWFVGLHVHEKLIGQSDEETAQMQDEEIGRAVDLSNRCSGDGWNVPELEECSIPGATA